MTYLTSGLRRPTIAAAMTMLGVVGLHSAAFAHVTLATGETRPNAGYKAVLKVPHGCDGQATQAIHVQIPDGVINVKPMPKPGWELKVTRGAYKKTYQSHGKPVTEGAREIVWSGGSLPDEFYDEFTFIGFVTSDFAPGDVIRFPTIQTCATAKANWVEIPAAGQSPHALKEPAPAVRVVSDASSAGEPGMDHAKMNHGGMNHGGMDHGGMGAPPAGGGSYTIGDLKVNSPWTRATPGGAKIAGGYLTITNTGKEPDRLVSATTAVADHAEIHEMSMTGGVMKMRPLPDGLTIKPGETVALKPGGYHMMFMGLKQPLKQGDTMKVTLVFEKAGKLDVAFTVGGIGASQAPMSMHKH
jgi:uncharacterized protein YcnI/copper(I)-binding protein